MIRTIKLEGKALDAARDLHDTFWASHREREALREEFNRRSAAIEEAAQEGLKDGWQKVLQAAGMQGQDPAAWGLDARYWEEHGLMFLTHNEVDDNPAAMHAAHNNRSLQ